MTKRKYPNCDTPQNLKLSQNSNSKKIQIARKLKKIKQQQNSDNQIVVKLNSNCDKTQTQIVTKLKN